MTLFGFKLWDAAEQEHIRAGQRRIGDALHGVADDLEAFREQFREGLAVGPLAIEAPAVGKKGRKV